MVLADAGLPQGAAVKPAVKAVKGRRWVVEQERLVGWHCGIEMGARGNGSAYADAATQGPPVVDLGLDDRLGRCNRRVEAEVTSKTIGRANRSLAQAIAHGDRRGGILALVFPHLPLPGEEPQRVEDGSV